jgi:GNAT superfamily N-acetyltransferase
MQIRDFRKEDAADVSLLIKECYQKLDIGGHTARGLQIQIGANSPENLITRSEKIKYYVAIDDNRVIGICGYDKEKIYTLFVNIRFHKTGIGKRLLIKVLDKAREDGLKSITVWSTIYAEEFYRSFGFQKRHEIVLPPDRSDIVLIEMIKTLSNIPTQ